MGLIIYILKHYPEYLRSLLIATSLVLMSILIGISGFILIEDYTLIEALYMTIITISTVGFKEVRDLSDNGRIFTSIFIVTNIGIFTYAVSTVASFIVEGRLRNAFKEAKHNMNIEELENHVIVCGMGRNGSEACEVLAEHKIPFVVIDKANKANDHYSFKNSLLTITGNATVDANLIKAGIHKAKALITTLPDDSDNLFIVLTARNMNKNLMIVSRASQESSEEKLKIAGANHIIMPEKIGGAYMAKTLVAPDAIEIFKLLSSSNNTINIEEFLLSKLKPEINAQHLLNHNMIKRTGANVIGLRDKNGKYIVNPAPNLLTDSDCVLIAMGSEKQLNALRELFTK
jgi:voltage-gated potassium channel